MIFYFSGTGNSLQAASCIARQNGEELVSVSAAMHDGAGRDIYSLKDAVSTAALPKLYSMEKVQ